MDLNSRSAVPEPVPDWEEGIVVWRWALPVHGYIFGLTFFAVAIYGVYNLCKLRQNQARKSRNYFICITALVCLFGLTRAVALIADPYSTGRFIDSMPGLGLLLFSLGYPCLTSGFFLMNWSLVEVTKLQLIPSIIHKRKVLALVLLVHFVVVITFDTIFVFFPSTHILLFICRSFFVVWGILLFGGFVIAARRLRQKVKQTLGNITQISMASRSNTNVSSSTQNDTGHAITMTTTDENDKFQEARTRKVMKISRRAAVTGLLICFTQTYALWEFYVFYNDDVIPKAWPWWIYQTIFRCIELFMVSQMFLIIRPRK